MKKLFVALTVFLYPQYYSSHGDPTLRDYLTDLRAAREAGDEKLFTDLSSTDKIPIIKNFLTDLLTMQKFFSIFVSCVIPTNDDCKSKTGNVTLPP